MKFYKLLFALVLSLGALGLYTSGPIYAMEDGLERYVNANGYAEDIAESILSDNELFRTRQRVAPFRSGFFYLRETTDKTGGSEFVSSFDIEGKTLTVWAKDKDKKLLKLDYSKGGTAPTSSELLIETDVCQLYLGQANQLFDIGDGLYKRQDLLPIEISKKDENSYNIKLRFRANKGAKNLSWGLYSTKKLLHMDLESAKTLFQTTDLQNRAILGFDGYMYYREDRKDEAFYLMPSPYLVTNFYKNEDTSLSKVLGHVLLKLAAKNINEAGYFPIVPRSEWLFSDYGMGGSYFDNRWNADLALAMMKGLKKQYDPELKQAYKALLAYFITHIKENSQETPNGGLLNYDYGLPGESIATHTSLNHQLNLINMLFEAALSENNYDYLDYAKKLIKGLEYIGMGWVKEDGALHYAYMVDGSLGMQDYDLLTYNDALITRSYMDRIEGVKSDVLVKIMSRKLDWIKNQGLGHIYE